MNTVVKREATQPAPEPVTALVPQNMDQAVRLAEMMARGKMLPEHLRGSPGDCLMIVEQAMRWRMSPFAVAQCTSSIRGKLMFEGKLLAAAIESSGAIQGGFHYEFEGEGMDRTITVSAIRTGEKQPREVKVTLRDAVTDNQIWKKQPDQQLVYHGTRVWGRRWTPSVILGVYSREEFNTGEAYEGTTIEGRAEAAPEPPAAPAPAEAPPPKTAGPRKQKIGDWLDSLELDLSRARSVADLDAILENQEAQTVQKMLTGDALRRFNGLIASAVERLGDGSPGEITPEERLGA